MSDRKRPPANRTSALLGDLESIRTLLEQSGDDEPVSDDDVPLLEDVVHGGVSVNETFLSGEGDFDETGQESRLDEDVFKTLLSERWRDSASELLDQARAEIGRHQAVWTAAHSDELNRALQERIDHALQNWLHVLVHSRMDELHTLLLDVIQSEIDRITRDVLDTPPTDEDRNGV
jgi:hypothetical protein